MNGDFRLFLQSELIRRCRKNDSYSLRSFARSLEISPSSLSRILRGERPLSEKIQTRLGRRLGLSPIQLKQYKLEKNQSLMPMYDREEDYNQILEDTFASISDWYHFAILELTTLTFFKKDPRWIAKKLGITASEAHAAVERLFRLKLLISDEGVWKPAHTSNTSLANDIRQEAYRTLQKRVLGMALDALNEIPVEKRDQSSMTMAINSKKLPEAVKMITRFRREFCRVLQKDLNRDEVFQLSISFFPVTRSEK